MIVVNYLPMKHEVYIWCKKYGGGGGIWGHKYLLIFAQFSTLHPLLNFDPLQTYEHVKNCCNAYWGVTTKAEL